MFRTSAPFPVAALLGLLLLLNSGDEARAGFPDLKLAPVSDGVLVAPVDMTHAGDGSGRFFMVDQRGKIQILDPSSGSVAATPFLDLGTKLVTQRNNFDERGLLGLAFHPDYAASGAAGEGKFYVYYSGPSPNAPGTASEPVDHRSVIAEYSVSAGDPNIADPTSERILLTFDQPQFNHDGGDLAFGPGGMLFISTGDGGAANDNREGHTGGSDASPSGVLGNAQDRTKLLGKILRIDPLGSDGPGGAYGIPSDNPFFGEGGGIREEIFAYGLRNPWRISFDDGPGGTGRLFVADVGQGRVEEINIVESGLNYGWRNREGGFDFDATAPGTGPFVDPIAQYAHPGQTLGNPPLPQIGLSVTGGEVYRGGEIPSLHGKYLFADWSTSFGSPNGTLLGLEETSPGVFSLNQLNIEGGNPIGRYITAIASAEDGELYVATRTVLPPEVDSTTGDPTGAIFRVELARPVTELTLSADRDTTLFSERPGNSNGAGDYLFAGTIAQGGERRALVRFDLSPLPADVSVESAALTLTMDMGNGIAGSFQLHRLDQDWGEGLSDSGTPGGQGAAAATDDATWNHRFFNTQAWTTPGGDFEPAASATKAVSGATTWTSSGLAQDVQDWLDGTRPNHGWILREPSTQVSAKRFASRESPNASARPRLVVSYTDPAPPAPAGLMLSTASDTGASDSDGVTSDATPTVEGIAPLASTVTLFADGVEAGSGLVSSIPFAITITSPFADGPVEIAATVTTAEGTSSLSAPLSIQIDTVAPTVGSPDLTDASDSGSSHLDGITSDDTPDFLVSGESGAVIQLSSDLEGVLGSAAAGAVLNVPSLSDGTHSITAVATDLAGNTSAPSAPTTVVIDTLAPSAPTGLDLLSSSDDGASDQDNETTIRTPEIAGSAETGSVVTLVSDLEGDVATTSGGTFTVTTSMLSLGAHQITATASDAAGNTSPTSSPLAILIVPPPTSEIVLEQPPATNVESGESRDFGDVEIGETADFTFTIGNVGGGPLTGIAATIESVEDGTFSIVTFPGATVSSGATTEVTVRFAPRSVGPSSATLRIASNDGDENPFLVNLAGAGADRRLGKTVLSPLVEDAPFRSDPESWTDEVAGRFDGLLRAESDGDTLRGGLTVALSRARRGTNSGGTLSGLLKLAGRTARLRGEFDGDGRLLRDFLQRDGSTVSLDLQLERSLAEGMGYVLRGTLSWRGENVIVDLSRANPPDGLEPGKFTALLPSQKGWGESQPGGDGWALVVINGRGVVNVRGVLGDGNRFTETAFLSRDAQFFLYTDLYRSSPERGRLGGRVQLRETENQSDFDGLLQWRKYPDSREPRYADGFGEAIWILGSRFTSPLRGERILAELADRHANAELSFIGPNAPGSGTGFLDRVLSWLPTNRLEHFGPERLRATANRRNGMVTGSFFDPETRDRVSFRGVCFQAQGMAAGTFVRGDFSGAVRVLPGTDFSYPGSEDAGPLTRSASPVAPAVDPVENGPIPFEPGAAGIYGGILDESGIETGALERVLVSPTGGLSGFLWLDGVRYRFRGNLLADGTASASISRPGDGNDIQIDFFLTRIAGSGDGFGLGGTVNAPGFAALELDAQRRPGFTRTDRSPQEGSYTLLVRAPENTDAAVEPAGDGYGVLAVNFLGNCRGLLVLADGTRTTLSGHVGRVYDDGVPVAEWSFHRKLYGRGARGYVTGKLTFREVSGISQLDGQWRWVRKAGVSPVIYPAGFELTRPVVGSRYLRPGEATRAVDGMADGFHNAWLRFSGITPSIQPAFDRVVTWTTGNRVLFYGPGRVTIRFNARNGMVSGSYLDRSSMIMVKNFGGVLLQEQALVSGHFLRDGQSGLLTIESR